MPGAYAHITMVNELTRTMRLETLGLPREAMSALTMYPKYVELGAISPDYPYLVLPSVNAAGWADAMHRRQTGNLVQEMARRVAALNGILGGQAFAWLLGYVAHVVADVTIHPVVNLKVGPYEENKLDHRKCEMHQDAYIFQRLGVGGIGTAEHIHQGLLTCSKVITGELGELWSASLSAVHPDQARLSTPKPAIWQTWFEKLLDKAAEEGHRLVPIARHMASDWAITYPLASEVDRTAYIDALATPEGPMSYDEVFDRAVVNIGTVWREVAEAVVYGRRIDDNVLGDWSLDTGETEAEKLVFWEEVRNA